MNSHKRILFSCLLCIISTAYAGAEALTPSISEWQIRRLMQPTQSEVSAESDGEIVIYDKLTDRQVSKAMDKHFSRIEAMMFTSIVITDNTGKPKVDAITGELIVENDGCDD
ncbi:MAG: hypothetical protein ABW124_18130 [Candidatus Thiodiazotropha sp. 6PLUC9]